MTAAVVFPTTAWMVMLTAAVMAVVLVMMMAHSCRIVIQAAGEQRFHCRVRIAGYAAVQGDPRLGQCLARAAADTAADQRIHAQIFQEARKRSMAAAVGIHHGGGFYFPFFYFVDFELCCMSKVLEYLSICISNRDFHA